MVSFSCEACGDIVKKPKLDSHKGQCHGAYYTCLDCNTTFQGQEYRSHTSCISEAQKVEKSVFKPKKEKGKQADKAASNSVKPVSAPAALPAKETPAVPAVNGEATDPAQAKREAKERKKERKRKREAEAEAAAAAATATAPTTDEPAATLPEPTKVKKDKKRKLEHPTVEEDSAAATIALPDAPAAAPATNGVDVRQRLQDFIVAVCAERGGPVRINDLFTTVGQRMVAEHGGEPLKYQEILVNDLAVSTGKKGLRLTFEA